MNKSHRTIWNESLGAWVAASEITKGRGKKSARQVTLAGAALGAALALGMASQAMAANECGAEAPGADAITCAASNYAGGATYPTFPTGITYTGSDGLTLTLDDPTLIIGSNVIGPYGVRVGSSAGAGGDISVNASDFDTITTIGTNTITNHAISVNLAIGYTGGASIILGEQAGAIATTGRSGGAFIGSNTSGPGDLLIEMHGGDITTDGFQANAIQINQSSTASTSTGDLTIRMTGGSILAEGDSSDGLTINNRGLGDSLVEMTGGSIEANVTSTFTNGNFANGIALYNINTNASNFAEVRMSGGRIDVDGPGSHGILLQNSGTGDSRISVTDSSEVNVAGTDSSGIFIRNGYFLTADTRRAGTFEVIVEGTAVVRGGSGDGSAILVGEGPPDVPYVGPRIASISGTIEIGAGATVDGSASGVAIRDVDYSSLYDGTNTTMIIKGTLLGDILAGMGDDSVSIEDEANIADVDLIDGGGGDADQITFSNWSGSDAASRGDVAIIDIDGAQISNMEEVLLSNGSDVTFGGAPLSNQSGNGLLFDVEAGSSARFAGDFTVDGNVNNFGTLDLSTPNGAPGSVLTVTGDYAGTGLLLLDVDTATDMSDMLNVAGDVTGGSTTIAVNNLSPLDATGNDITLVTVDGASSEGDFVLQGDSLTAGAFDYTLGQSGSSFVLSAAVNSTGAVYESAPAVLGAFNRLPTLEQRVGQRQGAGQKLARADAQQPTGGWIRVTRDKLDATTTTGSSIASKTWGLQAGADFALEPRAQGQWVLGVTGQYGKVNSTVTSALGLGTIDAEGFGVGATATWYDNTGAYVDLQGQANWIDSDIASSAAGALVKGHGTKAYALSAEVGRRFALSETTALVPQGQITVGRVNGGVFTDSAGNAVDLGSTDRLIGRLGLAYEYAPKPAAGGNQTKAYVIGNILHDFSGNSSVKVSGASLSSGAAEQTWGEIGVGGAYAIDANKTLYGEALYRAALGGGSGNNGLAATVGLRIQW